MSQYSKSVYVKDLKEKEATASPFLVKFSAVAVDKNGRPYMNLVLMDKTGEVEARLWEDVPKYVGQVVRDAFVHAEGKCQSYQGRRQIVLNRMQILREDEIDPKLFVPEGEVDAEALYAELMRYVGTM